MTDNTRAKNDHRVLVTGLGMITPVGLDTRSSWKALINGESGVDYITSFNAESFPTKIAGEIDGFDPIAYVGRKSARRMDRFAQLACAATLQAMEHGGLDMAAEDPTRVAVVIGSGVGGIQTLSAQFDVLRDRGPRRVNPFLIPMMLTDLAPGQVSMLIGARGPNFATVSACATGTDSIGEAFEMIRRGAAEVAFAGGTEAAICPIAVAGFNSCMALSKRNDEPQKASRPFDARRDGFVLGEGAGVMLLESFRHAADRGATPICELAGYGASSDAHHVTEPGPGGEGAARAMRLALSEACMSPADIDYVNAHGTSTPLNDKFETLALKSVFGENAARIPASSTKSMIGHLLGASGGVEAIVSALSIAEGVIHPTINLEHADPDCDLDYVPHRARRMPVRSAMTISMGFGGHNGALVFREFAE